MMVYEKMEHCFAKMTERVMEAVENTDLDKLFETLASIKGPTLVCGCGGSTVVSEFLAEVLREKNSIIATRVETRDVLKMNTSGYENVITVSYSGRNLGVEMSLDNGLKKYMLSVNEREGVTPLRYGVSEREISYISLSATMIPMAMAFLYYTDGNKELLREILDTDFGPEAPDPGKEICEILSGTESSAAAVMLESTMTEAGLCAAVVHDKYNFCHGRINLNVRHKDALIFFDNGTELDGLYKEHLLPTYDSVTILEGKYGDEIIDDFFLAYRSMHLCRALAEKKGIDLSSIEECPINDIFYLYKGNV